MKPAFTLTSKMFNLCVEIMGVLGRFQALNITKPAPQLRRSNRIKTVQASLAIEGNTLLLDHVTSILDGKSVIGSRREIREVQNTIKAYDQIGSYNTRSPKSLREAHGILMEGLAPDAGKWRKSAVGIFQGDKLAHTAPQAKRVPELMDQLFDFISIERETHVLILSAVFHYELEFIHPFSDGNGRLGRLWQAALLTQLPPSNALLLIDKLA